MEAICTRKTFIKKLVTPVTHLGDEVKGIFHFFGWQFFFFNKTVTNLFWNLSKKFF